MVSADTVLEALKKVRDPELKIDVVTLKMIKDLKVEDYKVSFTLELTAPACPFHSQLERDVRQAVESIPGIREVDIKTTARVWVGKPKTDIEVLPGVKNVIAIASGKGGVGKTTVAVNIAVAMAEMGSKVGLLDADIHGPSVPKALKMLKKPSLSQGRLIPASSFFDVRLVSTGLFVTGGMPMMWRGPMVSQIIKQYIMGVQWDELDYLFIDLPPGTGDASLTIAQSVPITGIVIVSTPQEAAHNIATNALKMFRRLEIPIIGMLENMSYSSCPYCGGRLEIFGSGGVRKVAEEMGTAFLGEIPLSTDIRVCGDKGTPIVVSNPSSPSSEAFRKAARAIAGRVSVIAHARQTGKPAALI